MAIYEKDKEVSIRSGLVNIQGGKKMATHEDKQKTVMINTRIAPELRQAFADICDDKQQTQAKVLRHLIKKYVEENQKKTEQTKDNT